jgi:mannitol/fructose-specific phosphotransferase system IIA component (Ntr-type)
MLLSDLLRPESILLDLNSPDRDQAIARLVAALGLPGTPADTDALRDAVLAREAAGSTGIGGGVAIPHARTGRVGSPRLAIGRPSPPLDFKSADDKPVDLVFLLAVPESDPKAHLKILAALSRIASDEGLLGRLRAAAAPSDLYSLLASIPV